MSRTTLAVRQGMASSLRVREQAFAWLAGAWLLIAAGCVPRVPTPALRPVIDPQAAWAHRQSSLAPVQTWKLHGRVSVREGQNGFSAGLNWLQEGDRYTLDLFDPLGRKTAVLKGSPQGAEISTSKGERASAADAEALMHRLLGWSAPVSSLRYWVLGLTDPHAKASEDPALDVAGRPQRLQQSGWTIEYPEYEDNGVLSLPHRINARGQKLEIKLLVKEWQFQVPMAPQPGLGGKIPASEPK